MVVRNTQGVGATLNLTTGVHTLSDPAAELETNFFVVAIGVVRTLSKNSTSSDHVLGISGVTRGTNTLSRVTSCPWSTFHAIAEVLATPAIASKSNWTVDLVTARTLCRIIAIV